jgi:hypothetical protein
MVAWTPRTEQNRKNRMRLEAACYAADYKVLHLSSIFRSKYQSLSLLPALTSLKSLLSGYTVVKGSKDETSPSPRRWIGCRCRSQW